MKDLHDAGLCGRLPCFIEGFLRNRNFCIHLGSWLSDLHEQELGVPQGRILSVTLFGLKINSIVKAISPGVDCSLYVDDVLICYRSKHIHIIERHMQQCLNKLYDWADKMASNFLQLKLSAFISANYENNTRQLCLFLNGSSIPVVDEAKFLGVIFDNKLSFLPHIQQLKNKCTKALNLLRVLAHTAWGADQVTLLHLYRSLIRSKLDYGCVV